MAMLYVLVFPAGDPRADRRSRSCCPPGSRAQQRRPARASEILYAFTSTAGNNGSAFAGLTGTTYYYNTHARARAR